MKKSIFVCVNPMTKKTSRHLLDVAETLEDLDKIGLTLGEALELASNVKHYRETLPAIRERLAKGLTCETQV